MKTTPELNATIANRLRMAGGKHCNYAALRIEELEEEKEIDGTYTARRIKELEAEVRRLLILVGGIAETGN